MTDALDDLVARLNDAASHYHATRTALFREAVTEITALRASVAELEADKLAILNGAGSIVGSTVDAASGRIETLESALAERDADNRALQKALDASVKLQSHYAKLLNMHDGGRRIQFADADEWLRRLAMTPDERAADCLAKE